MSHYRRAHIPGGYYFFTLVTLDRAPVFTDESRVEILREAMRQLKSVRPFRIDAMVVLPEHLHCIWCLPENDADFSSRWREIKKAVSRHIEGTTNDRNERPVWQRRFWEHAIRDGEDWRRHMDYIHYNPVKHGLTQSPGEWRWSSFSIALTKGWYDASWGSHEPTTIRRMDCE